MSQAAVPAARPPLTRMFAMAVRGFREDEVLTRAGSLAFFTALAFAPMLVLLLYATGLFVSDGNLLVSQVRDLLGPQAGAAVAPVLANATAQLELGRWSAWVSLAVLLISSTGVFVELQETLNRIWRVTPRPGSGAVVWLRRRAASLAMLAAMSLLLGASLLATSSVHLLFPDGWYTQVGSELASVIVFGLGFAGLFKFVPAAVVHGRDAALGGFVTAVLFSIGKTGIGLYLATSGIGSSYGAAGSLIALLLWVYYSSVILLFGAELTQAWARTFGHGIRPIVERTEPASGG